MHQLHLLGTLQFMIYHNNINYLHLHYYIRLRYVKCENKTVPVLNAEVHLSWCTDAKLYVEHTFLFTIAMLNEMKCALCIQNSELETNERSKVLLLFYLTLTLPFEMVTYDASLFHVLD